MAERWKWLHKHLHFLSPQNTGPPRHKLKRDVWVDTVKKFTCSKKRDLLLEALEHGIKVPFTKELTPTMPFVRARPMATDDNVAMAEWLMKEVNMGGISGPHDTLPEGMALSTHFVLTQRGGTKKRIISDLSYAPKGTQSVNDRVGLEPYEVKLIDVSDITKLIVDIGSEAWLCKIDLSDAYRHIGLCPEHTKYMGFEFDGRFYYHRVLPFGLNYAVYGCCLFSDAWGQIVMQRGRT